MRTSSFNFIVKIDKNAYFLMNSASCAMDFIDRSLFNQLWSKKNRVNTKDRKLMKNLLKHGFLTEKTEGQEIQDMRKFFTRREKELTRKSYGIIPTYKCNLCCPYCYQLDLRKKGKSWWEKTVTISEVDKILEIISILEKDSSDTTLQLYGGEPLLKENLEIIEYIFKRGANLGYKFGVTTNGVELEDFIPLFKKYGLEAIQITLDGHKAIHDSRRFRVNGQGTFDIIVKNIDAVSELNLECLVRVNVDAYSLKFIPDMLELFKLRGWDKKPNMTTYFTPIFSFGKHVYPRDIKIISIDELLSEFSRLPSDLKYRKAILDTLKEVGGIPVEHVINMIFDKTPEVSPPKFFGCPACGYQFIFDPHGDIYSCVMAVGMEEHKIGTYHSGFRLNKNYKIWKKRTVFNLPKCIKCKYAFLCAGGCAMKAYLSTDSISSPDCEGMKRTISALKSSLNLFKEKLPFPD